MGDYEKLFREGLLSLVVGVVIATLVLSWLAFWAISTH